MNDEICFRGNFYIYVIKKHDYVWSGENGRGMSCPDNGGGGAADPPGAVGGGEGGVPGPRTFNMFLYRWIFIE